jgi:hypothetical protein
MAIVTQCTVPGCETLTMGPLCVDHEKRLARMFVRGRPVARASLDVARSFRMTTAPTASVRTASVREAAVPLPR